MSSLASSPLARTLRLSGGQVHAKERYVLARQTNKSGATALYRFGESFDCVFQLAWWRGLQDVDFCKFSLTAERAFTCPIVHVRI
jgi:hypothetical protein